MTCNPWEINLKHVDAHVNSEVGDLKYYIEPNQRINQ